MKILQLIASLDPAGGGPVESLKLVSKGLIAGGHKTEVATLDDPKQHWLKNFSFPVHALGPGFSKYGYSRRYLNWLLENSKNYDCILVRGLWRYTTTAARTNYLKTGLPYFVFVHGMLDPWFNEQYPLKHLQKNLLWKLVEHKVLRDAKAVLFTAEEERVRAQISFAPYKCNERVVKYGIESAPPDLQEQKKSFFKERPELKDKRIILFLGRIHFKKGCDLLIRLLLRFLETIVTLYLFLPVPIKPDGKK